jgi:endoglycosylceramidase
MTFARAAIGVLASGALAACQGSPGSSPAQRSPDAAGPVDAGPAYVPQFHPLDSDGHVLRDAEGRTVILRGYNVKVSGLFDVTPDNGQPVRETIPLLDETDFALMRESGVNVLRLPVNWSAYEPQRGVFVPAYLDAVGAFLDRVRPYGFYVLLDFHEDGWSKDLCEDGAPAWATVTNGDDGGAPGADCHASNAALSAHSNFFDNDVNDMQEDFATMYQQFAARFVNEDLVFGYEIFNEPIASDQVVDAFSIKLATAIRQVDPRHLILWEPSALRNQLDQSLVSSTPFPVPGCVYAVHVYTSLSASDWQDRLANSISNARTEADAWGEPLFVTEHGADPTPDGIAWVDIAMTGFDQALASTMDWIWDPGVVTRDPDGGVEYLGDGGVLAHLTRPYAMAVGGDVTSTTWDGASLTIAFQEHPGVPSVHDVFWNRATPKITCDGEAPGSVKEDPTRLVLTVACGGAGAHTLVLSGG